MDAETKTVRAPASLRALVARAVDYAGLFPPSDLGMREAVHNYAEYLDDVDAWALGRFIVPISRLLEFETEAKPYVSRTSIWRLSALVGTDVMSELELISDFNSRYTGRAFIGTLEAKAFTVEEIRNIASIVPQPLQLFIEIPIERDPAELIRAIGNAGVGAKVRTGGVTADAFPLPADLAQFIHASIKENVPFKATAGLHHPVRSNYNLTYKQGSKKANMYGFLNVFLAAAFMKNGMSREAAVTLLKEESSGAFRFNDEEVIWQNFRLDVQELETVRQDVVRSFGSCSFREPLDDLRKINLLSYERYA